VNRRQFLWLIGILLQREEKNNVEIILCRKCKAQRRNCFSCNGEGGFIRYECDNCKGEGEVQNLDKVTFKCPKCEGKGHLLKPIDMNGISKCPFCQSNRECKICENTRKIKIELCKECKGLLIIKRKDKNGEIIEEIVCDKCNRKGFLIKSIGKKEEVRKMPYAKD
jgi:DnaJ-class molecular chaperone